jgi:hypothetical protein
MALPAFKSQIYIAAALTFDFTDSGGAKTAVLPASTYNSIHTYMDALVAAMDAASADDYDYSISSVGKISMTSDNATFVILWDTDTNGDMETFAAVMGFDHDNDDTGSGSPTTITANYQHQYGWYPTHVFARDTKEHAHRVGGEPKYTLSRKNSKRLYIAQGFRRRMDFQLVEPEYTLTSEATGSNVNKSFENEIWLPCAGQGYELRYYADASSASVTGTYYLDSEEFVPARPHDDYEAYNFSLDLTRQES